jgi:hypothetical protein
MQRFFDTWEDERLGMANKRPSLESRSFFLACCLALFSFYRTSERDSLFDLVRAAFAEFGAGSVANREELVQEMKVDISPPPLRFGVDRSVHYIENLCLFTFSTKKWFFVTDEHHIFVPFVRQISEKRIVISSYLSTDFENELANAILGNDFFVIFDYDTASNSSIIVQSFADRGKTTTVDIGAQHVTVPDDFQVAFIVDDVPDIPLFDSVFLDFVVSDDEIDVEVASNLFNVFDSEASQATTAALKTALESESDLTKTRLNLQTLLLNSEENILDDEKIYRQFVSASNVYTRLQSQCDKLQENRELAARTFGNMLRFARPFSELYHKFRPRSGIHDFYDLLGLLLSAQRYAGSRSEQMEQVLDEMRKSLISRAMLQLDFDDRMRQLCKAGGLSVGDFEPTIEAVTDKFGKEVLCQPTTVQDVVNCSTRRRPLLINGSYSLLKHLTAGDRVILCPISRCLSFYNEALSLGKGLVTVLNKMDEFPFLLSVVSKLLSAISLSVDFRFYVLSDFQPSQIDFPSCLLDFFDFVDTATLPSIRNRISFSMSALPNAIYDTKFSGQTIFWRRVLFLLAYFDAAANFMTQTLFQNVEFHDENLPLMVKYIRGFERPPFADLGALFVRTFYAVEQIQMTDNLLRIWRLLFAQENLTDNSVTLFGEYVLPANYPPGQAPLIASRFPFLDKSSAYCLPPDSGQHYQNFSVLQWKD